MNYDDKERQAWETWKEGIQARKREQDIADKEEKAGTFLTWTVLLMAASIIAFIAYLIWQTKLTLFLLGALVVITALAAFITGLALKSLLTAKQKGTNGKD
jgi:hypothetical protein